MAGNRSKNKARNQLLGGGGTNAVWFEKRKERNKARAKMAKASRQRNR